MKSLNELIEKYNRPGPRYTSYPPVPFWGDVPSETSWINHLKESYQADLGIDLYVHIPFCESLCYYCGCNRTITKNHNVESGFLESLLKEWEIYKSKLGFSPKINSLHFGGGTPTFLSPQNLERLITHLLEKKSSQFVGSIEVDPRTCSDEHLAVLSNLGIQRVSLGIQDFDPTVQKAINRDQSVEMVEALVSKLRQKKFSSINFDLIYGLPKQTIHSITLTIETVAKLKPDLIAFYSYAHLPDRIKNQRLIKADELPSPESKRELYETGKKLLLEKGYVDIGMDHFALPTSFLYKAMIEHRLHRNFMGYVDKKSSILIGLGPTSISDSSKSFIQNIKGIKEYEDAVNAGKLPFDKGHSHSQKDLVIQDIILEMMCHNDVVLKDKNLIPNWDKIETELKDFQDDGIIVFKDNQIHITPIGRGFVRNLAMIFDFHLREKATNVKFSQTI